MEIAAEPSAPPPQPPAPPAWAALRDEELLALRICDLGVRIEGSELEPRLRQFHEDLAQRGVALRPDCYLGDEWFSPEGAPAIAIPFYLAHPRLKALELRLMLEVEGGTAEWCQMLLRHECGHAIDHAYKFSQRPDWQSIFGSPEAEYAPETYTPRPYSRSFVRHLPNWYAQAHPDEDFAETFAVWLTSPPDDWRQRYRGWKALEKLEYVETLMQEVATTKPVVKRGRRISDARKLRTTLARHYAARRKLYAEDFPDVYDADLRSIFRTRRTQRRVSRQIHAPAPRRPHRVHRPVDRPTQIHRQHAGAKTNQTLPGIKAKSPRRPSEPLLRPSILFSSPGHQSSIYRPLQEVRLA